MYTILSSYYDVSSPMFASSILNHIPTVVFLHVGLMAKMPLSTSNEERRGFQSMLCSTLREQVKSCQGPLLMLQMGEE